MENQINKFLFDIKESITSIENYLGDISYFNDYLFSDRMNWIDLIFFTASI